MKTGKKVTVLILALFLLVTSAYGRSSNALVYVIHGIAGQDLGLEPALPVDVAVEGDCTLEGFTYGEAVGPLELPEGTYNIQISLANPDTPCGESPVIEADVPFVSGEVAVVIAHLAADGTPTASKFLLNASSRYPKFRHGPNVYLHHTAAAPEVDIKLSRRFRLKHGQRLIEDVSNGAQATEKLFPGHWSISLFAAGTDVAALVPIDLAVKPWASYAVFAVGSLDNGSLNLLIYSLNPKKDGELELVTALVYVIHGIPGQDLGSEPELPVDISLNDQCVLTGFEFGDITDAIPLTPGVYNVKIGLANPDSPCMEPAVIEADVPVFAGETITIIAHLTEEGDPTASVFSNDAGKRCSLFRAPLVVHHTAAAPAVDILALRGRWRKLSLKDVINGDQGVLNTRPGPWKVSILPAGSDDPVLGPVEFWLKNRMAYYLYAVGSLDNGTFTVLQNVVPLNN